MTHTPIDGVVVGKHPLVTRLIKGTLIVDLHSPDMHLLGVWEECLSIYICSLEKNNNISLKQLSHKLVVLLELSNASRASEIHALDI